MARSEHLPIYKRSYELCLYLEQVVRSFSRSNRYGLGDELRTGARRVLSLVVRANSRTEREPVLLEVREELEALKVSLRLAHDLKVFANFKSFEHAISLVVDVAKQNEGWPARKMHEPDAPNRRSLPLASFSSSEILKEGHSAPVSSFVRPRQRRDHSVGALPRPRL